MPNGYFITAFYCHVVTRQWKKGHATTEVISLSNVKIVDIEFSSRMFFFLLHGSNLLTEPLAPLKVDDALVVLRGVDILGDKVDLLDEASLVEGVPGICYSVM